MDNLVTPKSPITLYVLAIELVTEFVDRPELIALEAHRRMARTAQDNDRW